MAAAPAFSQEAEPAACQEHVRLGRQHLSHRNTFRASAEFRMALHADAAALDAWEGLARAAALTGDEEAALLAVHRAIELAPGNAGLHLLLGDVHDRASRRLAAVRSYVEVERCARAGDPLPADELERVRVAVRRWQEEDPEIVAKARAAAEGPGPMGRLCLRYFSQAAADGSMRNEGSIEAGKALVDGLLRRMAFDGLGFPVRFQEAWEAGSGLRLEGSEPLLIRAVDRAWNARLTLGAVGGPTRLDVTVPIRVIGPLTRLAVRPADVEVQAGQRTHFLIAASDEAGHRLWLPEVHWSLDAPTVGELRRAVSTQPAAHFFEPHRNILDPAAGGLPPEGSGFRIVAGEPTGKVQGVCECTVVAGPAPAREERDGIVWSLDFEEAVARARRERTPLMVEFTAEW